MQHFSHHFIASLLFQLAVFFLSNLTLGSISSVHLAENLHFLNIFSKPLIPKLQKYPAGFLPNMEYLAICNLNYSYHACMHEIYAFRSHIVHDVNVFGDIS